MLGEFKEFINRGNVVELAVGFVLGVAFSPIVSTLVDRVLMPAIGLVFGEPNFDTIGTFACEAGADPSAGVVVGDQVCAGSLGAVVTVLVNFLLIALAMFFLVRAYNRLNRPEPDQAEPDADPEDIVLLREIRDLLRTGR